MNYSEILDELRTERDMVDQAISVLERLQVDAPRRRGRPPQWLSDRKKEAGPAAVVPAAVGPDGQPVKRGPGRPRKVQPAT